MNTQMKWEKDRIFPVFGKPAKVLDALITTSMSRDMQLTLSALQGIVNRTQPRILMLDAETNEGMYTWPRTMGLEWEERDALDVLKKYINEAKGAVIYSEEKSPHYLMKWLKLQENYQKDFRL